MFHVSLEVVVILQCDCNMLCISLNNISKHCFPNPQVYILRTASSDRIFSVVDGKYSPVINDFYVIIFKTKYLARRSSFDFKLNGF